MEKKILAAVFGVIALFIGAHFAGVALAERFAKPAVLVASSE